MSGYFTWSFALCTQQMQTEIINDFKKNILRTLAFLMVLWLPGVLLFGERRQYFRKYTNPSPSSSDETIMYKVVNYIHK